MSIRTARTLATLAAAAVMALVASPLAAQADPVVVHSYSDADLSFQVERDGGDSVTFRVTNTSAASITVGLAADLVNEGVLENLWQNPWPLMAEATQEQLDPGETREQSVPIIPGHTVALVRDIDVAPAVVTTYLLPGRFLPLALGGTDDEPFIELGPTVTVTSPVIESGGFGVTASGLAPGAVSAFLTDSASVEFVGDDYVPVNGALFPVGSGVAASDGSVFIPGTVPAGLIPGSGYTVVFEQDGAFGLHVTSRQVVADAGTATPTSAGTVGISGPARIGGTLAATVSGFLPDGVQVVYQWRADNAPIPGATASSYVVTAGEQGRRLSVTASAWGPGYVPSSTTSAPTAVVPALKTFTPPTTPTVVGTVQVGAQLEASTAGWDPLAQLSFEWRADGTVFATTKKVALAPAQAGAVLEVVVTGSRVGYATIQASSSPTAPVALGALTPPANADRPKIAGQARVGGELRMIPGSWGPAKAGAALAYQWQVDGADVAGADQASFVVPPSALGATVSARLTVTAPGYATEVRTVAVATPIAPGVFVPKGTLTIVGTAAVGQTLTADVGTWSPTPDFSYQWSVGGVVLGETPTFVVPSLAHNKKVVLTVVASSPGYQSVTRGASTAKVP